MILFFQSDLCPKLIIYFQTNVLRIFYPKFAIWLKIWLYSFSLISFWAGFTWNSLDFIFLGSHKHPKKLFLTIFFQDDLTLHSCYYLQKHFYRHYLFRDLAADKTLNIRKRRKNFQSTDKNEYPKKFRICPNEAGRISQPAKY